MTKKQVYAALKLSVVLLFVFVLGNRVEATLPNSNQRLISALDELQNATFKKIDLDKDAISSTFSMTADVDKSLQVAYLFKASWGIIKDTIWTIGETLSFGRDPVTYINDFRMLQKWVGLIDRQKATGEDLQFTLDGYAYTTEVQRMLDSANSRACRYLCLSFDVTAYKTEVNNYLDNAYGTNYLAIPLRTNELNADGTRRKISKMVHGTSSYKTEIANRIKKLKNFLNANPLPPNFPIDSVLADINSLANGIDANRRNYYYNTAFKDGSLHTENFDLGNIVFYWAPYAEAMGNLNNDLFQEQIQIVTDSAQSTLKLTKIYLNGQTGSSKTVEQVIKASSFTIATAKTAYSAYTGWHKTTGRSQIHEIPQDMLFNLPHEWSALWEILDDYLNNVEQTINSPLVLFSNLNITPAAFYEGQSLNAEFTVKNNNQYSARAEIATRCYLDGVLGSSYTTSNISMSPGGSFTHKGTINPGKKGYYQCFAEYREDINAGWKRIPSASGIENIFNVTVNAIPTFSASFDAATFVSDVTYPDGTSVSPSQSFTKTWRIKNTGTTTWNTNYKLTFYSGERMGGPLSLQFPYSVAPGNTMDISVNLTAPSSSGTYTGYWALQNQSGINFGFKPFVQIAVPNQTTNTVTTPVNGDLIRATGTDRMYLVKGGRKWWINSPSIFTSMGYQWGNVKDYPSIVIDLIPYGPIIVADGSLIRQQGDTKVFLIQNSQRRWIISESAFVAGGYSWNDVMDVPASIIGMFQQGSDISEKPRVIVTSPNGGEAFIKGNSYNLLWSANDDSNISTIGIYYSTDGSVTWNLIAVGLPNNGHYAWTPSFTAPSAKIKVVAYDSSGLSGEDMSDGVFSVSDVYTVADLSVISVALSAYNLSKGQSVNVSTVLTNEGNASSIPMTLAYYFSASPLGRDIYLGSSNVSAIGSGSTQIVNGSIVIPSSVSAQQGYIVAEANPGAIAPESTTGNNAKGTLFSIADTTPPIISHLSLPSYSFFRTRQKYTIVFAAMDDVGIHSTAFYYSTDSVNWATITSFFIPGSNGLSNGYEWMIPDTLAVPSSIYIKMVARDASGNVVEKIAGPYTFKDGTAPSITVLYPNGGEVFDLGSAQTIKWSINAPNGVGNMDAYVYWGNTANVVANLANNGSGAYSWTIPTVSSYVTTGARIKIRIEDLNGNVSEDWSDGYFSIRDNSTPPPAPWNEPQVLTSVPIENMPYTTKGDSTPVVATDSSGNVHLAYVYTQDDISGTVNNTYPYRAVTQKVFYKKLSNGIWSAPQEVYSLTQYGTEYHVFADLHIKVDGNGYPHVVWNDVYSGSITEFNKNDIFYTHSNGSAWSPPINLSDNISGAQQLTSISWSPKADLPVAKYSAASTVLNGKLYVFGGSYRLSNYEYEPSTQSWTRKADLPGNGIDEGGAAVINNMIYAVGDPFDNNIKIYNPLTDAWTTGAKIPTPRRFMAVAAVNGKLYAIGGGDNNLYTVSTVEEYDPTTNTWVTKTNIPTARYGAAAVVVNNLIYVFGGISDGGAKSTVEVYDPLTDTWQSKTPMPRANGGAVAAIASGKIYLVGGRGSYGQYLNTVDEYDPATESWLSMTSMSTPRAYAAGGAIGTNIYVVGGINETGSLASNEEAIVTVGSSSTVSIMPSITVDPSNNVHVVWRDGYSFNSNNSSTGERNIYYRKKDATGNWSSVAQLTTGNGASWPALEADSAGNLHLAYRSDVGDLAYIKFDGVSWSAPIAISSQCEAFINIFVRDNIPNLVWYYYDGAESKPKIFYSRLEGASWTTPESISNIYEGYPSRPSIVVDLLSRPHVFFEDGVNSKLAYSYNDQDGWSIPVQINKTTQRVSGYVSSVAISPSDTVHTVWASYYNGSPEVFYNYAIVAGSINDVTAPVVNVTSPIAGSLLTRGEIFNITWSAKDNIGVNSIDIEYSTDNGASYSGIVANIANSGYYQWTVPQENSSVAMIRVTAKDAAGSAGVGLSGVFSIGDKTSPSVMLSIPNGGEQWVNGSQQTIQWSATDNVEITGADIYYSGDDGASWTKIGSDPLNSGSISWTVLANPTSAARIKILAMDAAENIAEDQSDWSFAIEAGNKAPNLPVAHTPLNNVSNIPANITLSWQGGDPDTADTVTYDVYFGITNPPQLVSANQAGMTYSPGILENQKLYFWQIIAKDDKGNFTAGPIWSFITESIVITTPVISIDRLILVFNATNGGQNPSTQTLSISNAGIGTMSWTANTGAPWLRLSQLNGTDDSVINVVADIAGLSPGIYKTNIQISSSGASNSPIQIPVTLYVIKPIPYGMSNDQNDSGIEGVSRSDGGTDTNNIDSETNKPRNDLSYNFSIILKDPSGIAPQYVGLYITQRSNPVSNDFYNVQLTCTGFWDAGATCGYETLLAPAANHKYYFEAKLAGGTVMRYPGTGTLDGPVVELLNGRNMVSVPRDLGGANMDGSTAFGSALTYKWVSTGLTDSSNKGSYVLIDANNPVKPGEGFFTVRNGTGILPEHGAYNDVAGPSFTAVLKAGWNMVSNPYGGNVRLSSVKIKKDNAAPVTWASASTSGWMVNAIYFYKGSDWGSAYTFESAGGSPDATLVPWLGYWVYLNKADGEYRFIIPRP